MQKLEGKVRNLEKQVRRLKILNMVLIFLLASAFVTWWVYKMGVIGVAEARPSFPKVIEAEKFVLKDNTGKPKALFGLIEDDNPALLFFDEGGKSRGYFGLKNNAPGLAFNDERGKMRVALGLSEEAGPFLSFLDEMNEVRFFASLGKTRTCPLLQFYDGKETRISIGVVEDGAVLTFCDKQGHPKAGIGVKEGEGFLLLFDSSGQLKFSK